MPASEVPSILTSNPSFSIPTPYLHPEIFEATNRLVSRCFVILGTQKTVVPHAMLAGLSCLPGPRRLPVCFWRSFPDSNQSCGSFCQTVRLRRQRILRSLCGQAKQHQSLVHPPPLPGSLHSLSSLLAIFATSSLMTLSGIFEYEHLIFSESVVLWVSLAGTIF